MDEEDLQDFGQALLTRRKALAVDAVQGQHRGKGATGTSKGISKGVDIDVALSVGGEVGGGRKRSLTSVLYTTISDVPSSTSSSSFSSSSSSLEALRRLVRVEPEPVGTTLMRRMGWKEGEGVGPRLSKKVLRLRKERQAAVDAYRAHRKKMNASGGVKVGGKSGGKVWRGMENARINPCVCSMPAFCTTVYK